MLNLQSRIHLYEQEIKTELLSLANYQPAMKDILIVTYNNFSYLISCLKSIQKNTQDYQIHVWDNANDEQTKNYCLENKHINYYGSNENLGFIIPNNRLAEKTIHPYIIFLNDDTVVYPNWDKLLIQYLKVYEQVGYLGGILNENMIGERFGLGANIDYICGWCFGISRNTYDKYGLFDEQLNFAYGEDSDFSLRLKNDKKKIFALYSGLVHHFENKTVAKLPAEKLLGNFEKNHILLKDRWAECDFLIRKSLPFTDL